jgi:hypothetical protein
MPRHVTDSRRALLAELLAKGPLTTDVICERHPSVWPRKDRGGGSGDTMQSRALHRDLVHIGAKHDAVTGAWRAKGWTGRVAPVESAPVTFTAADAARLAALRAKGVRGASRINHHRHIDEDNSPRIKSWHEVAGFSAGFGPHRVSIESPPFDPCAEDEPGQPAGNEPQPRRAAGEPAGQGKRATGRARVVGAVVTPRARVLAVAVERTGDAASIAARALDQCRASLDGGGALGKVAKHGRKNRSNRARSGRAGSR